MRHKPVLLKEVIDFLSLDPNMNVVDCTLGDAGHAEEMLKAISPQGKLLGIDADPESILRAKQFLYEYQDRTILVRDNFVNLKKIVKVNDFSPVNAILMDLGWSSPQFEERGRGFSFLKDEPLDMRYFVNGQVSDLMPASEILNTGSEEELEEIFRVYGEEKFSKKIAGAIVAYRKKRPVKRTSDLVHIVLEVYKKKFKIDKKQPWTGKIHPATKTFQALRIAVNNELEVLEKSLPQATDILKEGGRLAVISFHSLEDRIVKHYFKKLNRQNFTVINKKPITAEAEELKKNPRSRSAKLRVIEKNKNK
ncbi:MAG: 16S rRNA (cytosine(1402)-N(4))-methyltransferase RsmH [Candidatus Magasanikbacteria bacterium]|nr:16S rRNA (cytosine(1402)-N(4))-methyltransferase RsmH [Candidatus Magasanikbacteria bacterium]